MKPELPSEIKLTEDFLTPDEEAELIALMPPTEKRERAPGRVLVNRQLWNMQARIPLWLWERLEQNHGYKPPRYCYVVEYLPAMDGLPGNGIEMHSDCGRIWCDQTHIVSLGSDCWQVWEPGIAIPPDTRIEPNPDTGTTLRLPARSLLHFWGDAFRYWMHGVMPVEGPRWSVVCWTASYSENLEYHKRFRFS